MEIQAADKAAPVAADELLICDSEDANDTKRIPLDSLPYVPVPGTPEQGDVFYRDAAGDIVALPHGTAGQVLKTGGDAADPAWGDETGGSGIPDPASPEQGDILYRAAGDAWAALPHGTAGQVLTTGGHAANPSWADAAGGGDVTTAMFNRLLAKTDIEAILRLRTDNLAYHRIPNGIIDGYEDDTGIDWANTTMLYDSVNDRFDNGKDAVVMLLHMDGSDDGTTFTDSSTYANTPTRVGAPVTKTGTKWGGTASGYFDGSDDRLRFDRDAELLLGSDPFSISARVRSPALPPDANGMNIYATNDAADLTGWFHCGIINYTGGLRPWFQIKSETYWYGDIVSMSNDTWYFLEFDRAGDTIYCFLDGVAAGTIELSTGVSISGTDASQYFNVGGRNQAGAFWNGYIDEFRIVKGLSQHTTAFTSPAIVYGSNQLQSVAYTAATSPTSARLSFASYLSSYTLNTDLLAYVSRDDGATWAQVTLASAGLYDTDKYLVYGAADFSGDAGTNLKYKFVGNDAKLCQPEGVVFEWY